MPFRSFNDICGHRLNDPLDKAISGRLVPIVSAALNRSMNALEKAGAIDVKKWREHYTGIWQQVLRHCHRANRKHGEVRSAADSPALRPASQMSTIEILARVHRMST